MSVINVLLVDDDILFCRIVHRMLSKEGYTIQTSQSIADALGAIEQKHFDVYVIDYKLPDGTGLDVAERIRSKWGATPIILISGYDPSGVALRAQELGISEFIEKPFSQETICNAIKKAMGPSPKAASGLSPGDPPISPVTCEGLPLIQTDLDIIFVHRQNERWFVDLVAFLENKGKARLAIEKFDFELRYSLADDTADANTVLVPDMFDLEDGLKFPMHLEMKGPWISKPLPIILDPGLRIRHSLLASLREDATTALFAIQFDYPKNGKDRETQADARLVAVPKSVQDKPEIPVQVKSTPSKS
jgi:CheY-like chemotaxis protein